MVEEYDEKDDDFVITSQNDTKQADVIAAYHGIHSSIMAALHCNNDTASVGLCLVMPSLILEPIQTVQFCDCIMGKTSNSTVNFKRFII